MHASQAAVRNHQKDKLGALRNAVLNAALPTAPEEDKQLIFLDLDDLLAERLIQPNRLELTVKAGIPRFSYLTHTGKKFLGFISSPIDD